MIDYLKIPEERMKILRKNKNLVEQLESFTNSKIELNDEISVECENSLTILRIKEVLKGFGRGFDFNTALNLLDEDYYLEIIDLRDYAGKSRKRMLTLRGRVIGTKGKTKRLIEKYADVKISIYGKTISIIGKWNGLTIAKKAIEMLLSGSEHKTVYKFLEKVKS